jgi:hypothetical protein
MRLMRCFHSSRGVLSACSLALMASFVAPAGLAREVFVTHTNSVERSITNVIEVRIPKNVFVSEYQTNWVSEFKTNVVSVYQTNQVLVELVRTNLVTAYRTNFETRNVTNWQTVQVLKTNAIHRPAANVAKTDAPSASPPVATSAKSSPTASSPVTSSAKSSPAASPVTSSAKSAPVVLPPVATSAKSSPASQSVAASPGSADGLVVEAARPPVKIGSSQWEVTLQVRSGKNTASPVVQRWRVEHLDAGVLNFKQGQVLTLELTPGRYQIEAILQQKKAARTLLVVTPDAALLQPSPSKNLASTD